MAILLGGLARKDAMVLLEYIFAGDEKRTQEILTLLSREERTQITEALEIAANVIDPDGHDCRAGEDEDERTDEGNE